MVQHCHSNQVYITTTKHYTKIFKATDTLISNTLILKIVLRYHRHKHSISELQYFFYSVFILDEIIK